MYVSHGVAKWWHREKTVLGTPDQGGQAVLVPLPLPGVIGLKI